MFLNPVNHHSKPNTQWENQRKIIKVKLCLCKNCETHQNTDSVHQSAAFCESFRLNGVSAGKSS